MKTPSNSIFSSSGAQNDSVEKMDAARIQARLTLPSSLQIECVEKTSSTNTLLAERAAQGAPDGLVIFAESQSLGRGRRGRQWESPAFKNLYASILMRPRGGSLGDFKNLSTLTLWIGLSCYRVLKPILGDRLWLKWPNDLYVGPKKLGGILVEAEFSSAHLQHLVIGIGLNVNSSRADFSEALASTATSILQSTGKSYCRETLAAELLNEILRTQESFWTHGFESIRAEWEDAAQIRDQSITLVDLSEKIEGVCRGVDLDGALLVETQHQGIKKIFAGDLVRATNIHHFVLAG